MAEALQNRWYHAPKLHHPTHGEHRTVGWLELFYDLIYVAAIIQLGNALSENVGLMGFLGFFGVMAPLWFAWTSFTFFSNRFIVDDVLHRTMVFVQMMFIGAVAIFVPGVFAGEPQGFAIAYASVRVLMALFYVRTWVQSEEARDLTLRYSVGFGLGATLWVASAFVDAPYCFIGWALALGVDFATTVGGRQPREMIAKYPVDAHHLAERFGLLTIIVLGESFVKVLSALAEHGLDPHVAGMGVVALGVTCFLWWLYFDDIGGSRVKNTMRANVTWVYTHLPFTVAVVAVGVAIKKAVFWPPMEVAPVKYRWLICGTLALALISAAILDHVTERAQAEMSDRARTAIRAGAAAFVLLLAPIGAGLSAWMFLTLLSLVCILQVAFDLLTAPLAADPHSVHNAALFAPATPVVGNEDGEDRGIKIAMKTRRGRVSVDTIRKGTPSELRRDLYFHLMEGSWPQLLAIMTVAFLLLNAVFAAFYMLTPGGVTGLAPNDFWGAFAFSVQTMSTIGYGAMSPQTGVADLLVTVEAAVGLLTVALATGIMFAKIARPTSSVLFSSPLVITQHDGKRTLSFRVGNARGNEIVEAHMRLSVILNLTTAEGLPFRRLFDLHLERDNSPIFTMSWTVLHVIDEASPLWGMSEDELYESVVAIIASMTGYDSTYAQTTHARHMYVVDDIREGHRFIDVIYPQPDGRLLIDYEKFHLSEPDPHLAGRDDGAGEEE